MRRIFRLAALLVAITSIVAVGVFGQETTTAPQRLGIGSDGSVRAVGVSPSQRVNLAERIALAKAIVDSHQAEAENLGLASGWRQAMLESLLALPLNRLRELSKLGTMNALSTALSLPVESDTFGANNHDLVYHPITPCRYIDTRIIGGKISGVRDYDIVLNGANYGGVAACNPTALFGVGENDFGGLAFNVTIIGPTMAPGYAAIKPNTAAPTTSLINWYEAGPGVQVANQAIITTDQTGETHEFIIQTSSPVDVIVDVFGAFIANEATAVSHNILEGHLTVAVGVNDDVWSPPCPAGWKVTGGGFLDLNYNGPEIIGSRPVMGASTAMATGIDSADRWLVQVHNGTATPQTVWSFVICSRVPGR